MGQYIKIGTTEFEQFDGSDEIIEKYGIRKNTEYKLSTVFDHLGWGYEEVEE